MSRPPTQVQDARFGVFEADFRAGVLRKAGIRIKIHDQPLKILAMLLEHPGELVTRENIRNQLWPGDTFVDFDHGLNNAVNRLRDALGDSADSPRWIETLPRRGYRFIGEVRLVDHPKARFGSSTATEVDEGTYLPPTPLKPPNTDATPAGWGRWLLWLIPAAAAVSLVTAFAVMTPPVLPSSRSFVLPPDGTTLNLIGDDGGSVTLSPDGTKLAFVALDGKGSARIWVRSLGKLAAESVAGTDNATFPFWSADGASLGFFADGKLKRIGLDGGPPVALCGAPFGRGGSWNRNGVIIFAPDSHSPIYQVSASGGTPAPVTTLDSALHTTHRWPKFLPDSRHFIYLAANHFPDASHNGVYFASLDDQKSKLLVPSDADATYASGYLFFLRPNVLMAEPFDPASGEFRGQPRPTVEKVLYDPSIWKAVFDASQNGVMAYLLGDSTLGTQLTWFDSAGKKLGDLGDRNYQFEPSLAPDGRRLAIGISDGGYGYSHVWVYDLARGNRMQVTFGKYDNGSPIWSRDGAQLLIAAKRDHYSLFRVDSSGVGTEQLVLDTGKDAWPQDLSPDGHFLLFAQGINIGRTQSTLWIYPLHGNSPPVRLLDGDARESDGQFSPDGRWIAYTSNQSGRDEVYVVPFPGKSASPTPSRAAIARRVQVSLSGGNRPRWRRDGGELFYMASDNAILSVSVVNRAASLEVGPARPLFHANPGYTFLPYVVTAKGNKFIIVTAPPEKAAPITLVENWPSDFRK